MIVFPKARNWTLCWATWIQSTLWQYLSPRSILIVSSDPHLNRPPNWIGSSFDIFRPNCEYHFSHLILMHWVTVLLPHGWSMASDWLSWLSIPTADSMEQKPIFAGLVSNFPDFIGPWDSLPCLQEPATGPCPEPDESISHFHILFL
jgi:hypothetical protein